MRIPIILAACGLAFSAVPANAQTAPVWAGAWGYAPADSGAGEPVQPAGTYRYRVRLSQAGNAMQLTFSNAEGDAPLAISQVTVASPIGAAGTEPRGNTVHPIVFGGKPGIALPRGRTAISDPLVLPLTNAQDVIVSVTFSTPTRPGRTNLGMEMAFAPSAPQAAFTPIKARPYLSLVSVRAPAAPCTVVAFGDSITDGYLGLSAQTRGWPGRLAERMAQLPAARRCGVVNMGISGNRVLRAGRAVSALERFWRDVASVPNVTHVVFLEGINDIGGSGSGADAVTPEDLLNGYRQFVARAHALGIKVIGGTITPAFRAGYMSPAKEQVRQAVNAAIRTGKVFDGVVDFEAAVRNPAAPADLRPEFDPGDHLHPNDAGLRAMGDAVNLALLTPRG
ncbi:lysophospholipase [Novosphingobium barchaimii LL02]|uniref:Lysophospholipase n=1 Tax=Novosphingobium barchaimii LL02 TaxID=1114963 RepID=A0A0J8ANV2_9SPHN|nr:SGNH/GDSL hydrolase family protein [Novosphingobium barchaimii]KMS56175.1 lysophospholipase [Novosphingobium barchaimii LL02]